MRRKEISLLLTICRINEYTLSVRRFVVGVVKLHYKPYKTPYRPHSVQNKGCYFNMIEVTLENSKKMFVTTRLIVAFYDVSDVGKEGVNTCIYLSNTKSLSTSRTAMKH